MMGHSIYSSNAKGFFLSPGPCNSSSLSPLLSSSLSEGSRGKKEFEKRLSFKKSEYFLYFFFALLIFYYAGLASTYAEETPGYVFFLYHLLPSTYTSVFFVWA